MSNVIGNLRVVLGLDSAAFQRGMQDATKSLHRIGQDMQRIGRSLSVRLTAPIAGFGALAIRTAADFEGAMNRVAAVSGATGDDLAALTAQARELGATTQFSASEAADAMGFLAMAGYETNEILGAMPDTLKLASAAQLDMADAADIVTNILAGYSMEVEDLAHANDVLVKAFTSANTDLRQLGEAMKYAGPVASAAGVEFEEAAAALAMMGNAGIQGSMAGTSLRGAIARILSPTKSMRDAMADAGLSGEELEEAMEGAEGAADNLSEALASAGLDFTDATGRILPLVDIIEQLEPHADDAGLMMQLFGQRAGPAMAALVSQGSDSVRDLTQELRDSAGTADRISAIQMQGFNGAIRELKSAFEELQIAVAESGLMDFVARLVRGLTQLITRMNQASPETLKWATVIAAVAAALGPVLIGLGTLLTGIGPFISGMGALVTAAKAVAVVFAGLSAPVTAAVAVIAGAAFLIWENWETVGPWFKDLLGGIGDYFMGLVKIVAGVFTLDMDLAAEGLQQAWAGMKQFFETLWQGVVAAFEWALEKIKQIVGRIKDEVAFLGDPESGINRFLNRFTGVSKGPISSGPYTGGATGPIIPGTDIVMGLEDGTEGIRNQGRTDAQAYGDGFREGMGIQSPSRVMIEIGEYLSQGLAIGIGNGQDMVSSESDRVGQSFADSIMPYFDGVIRGTTSVKDAFASMLRDMAARLASSGLSSLLSSILDSFGGIRIPGFAGGGSHQGGWRIVGEHGPELEATGPARYFTAGQTRNMMGGGSGPVNINVNVEGANGDQHVISLVQQGVSMGLRQYDRALPDRIGQINNKPRWR